MKKLKLLWLPVAVALCLSVFAACTTTDPETEEYTVTYIDGTDGTTVLKTETVEEGGYATEWTPEKDGYNFVGWYGEPSFTHSFDFTTAITADTSVFAAFSSAVTVTDTRDFYIVGSGTSPL